MIRPATLGDVKAIAHIANRYAQLYPLLRPSKEKINALVIDAISSARHFCYVSEDHYGDVTGVIAGMCNENTWAERQACHIMLWVSKVVGDGRKMLAELKKWIRSRRAVRVVGFAPDTDAIDPRVWTLVQRIGFRKAGGAYLYYN